MFPYMSHGHAESTHSRNSDPPAISAACRHGGVWLWTTGLRLRLYRVSGKSCRGNKRTGGQLSARTQVLGF